MEDLLQILLLTLPGFAYILGDNRRRPRPTLPTALEAARIAVVAAVASTASFFVLSFLHRTADMPLDPSDAFKTGDAALLAAVAISALGSTFAWIAGTVGLADWLGTRFANRFLGREAHTPQLDLWWKVFHEEPKELKKESTETIATDPSDTYAYLTLELKSGKKISGYLQYFSTESNSRSDREIAIQPLVPPGGIDDVAPSHLVVVSADEIELMHVEYGKCDLAVPLQGLNQLSGHPEQLRVSSSAAQDRPSLE